jgi:hypothetical protein
MYSVVRHRALVFHSTSENDPICASKLLPPTVGIKNSVKDPPEVQGLETGMGVTVKPKEKRDERTSFS